MKRIAAALLVGVGLMQTPGSAEPARLLDGQVRDLNPRVHAALLEIRQANQGSGVLTAQTAQFLGQEILADHQIDAGETDLLVELTQDKSRLIRITPTDRAAEPVVLGTAFGAARLELRGTLLPQATLDGLLTSGADGWKQLAWLEERSPADRVDVQAYLQKHIGSLWKQSTLENKYQPVRGFAQRADMEIQTLAVEDQKRSRAVLYEAFLQADAQAGDTMPNVFYNSLK